MLHNFKFMKGECLAGCAHLGRGRALRDNLDELTRTYGITTIVTLSEKALPSKVLEEFGLRFFHLPVKDFGVSTVEETAAAVGFVRAEIGRGGRVVVHCDAGYGRTGTFLACCLVANGCEAHEAIARIRNLRPGSVETYEQETFVQTWADWFKKSRNGD